MSLEVIESVPVHEDIKLGLPTRDWYIDNYCESVQNIGRAGVRVLCYNFMPVFDWMRTELARPLSDGSTALAYEDSALTRIDLSSGTAELPGWATAYSAREMEALLDAYRSVDEKKLWENLAHFLERVVPVAASSRVKMALHPDDPPVPTLGDYPTLAEVIGLLLHAIFLDALEADAERIERINRTLARVPAGAAPEGLRPVSLLMLRPSRDLGALAAGSGAKLPPAVRWVVRRMGGHRTTAVDFLSYLLFDPAYTTALIELGYADGRAEWPRIEQFLAAVAE